MVRPAPGDAIPVHTGAADAFARQERAEAAHGQRGLLWIVAHDIGLDRRVHHHAVAGREAKFVANERHGKIVLRRARRAALQHDDLQAGGAELLGKDAAGPAHADDDNVDGREFCRHDALLLQDMSAMPTGLEVKRRPSEYCFTFSALLAMTPGKPSIFQPTLSLLPP